ncbi:MAG TPA: hypothetical protein VF100_12570 [Thermoanaerobaculia bacterium]
MRFVRRFLRELSIWGPLVALIAAGGLFAWGTHHPDAGWLVAAEEWPGVGDWVGRFRDRYSGRQAAARHRAVGGREVVVVPEWVSEPGDPMAPAAGAAVEGHAWVAAGEPLREAPDDRAAVRGRVDGFRHLPVVERRGEWARVLSPAGEGWVRPFRGRAGEPPLGRGTVPPRPLPGRAADPRVLAAAVDLLGVAGPAGRLGPYALYTDAPRARLFALDRLAAAVEPVYRARYGRTPVGEPRETIVLFAREEDYRRFQSADELLAGLPAAGHTAGGVVAFHLGEAPAEVAATLVHELAHLLNRRALGPMLPPWLDEGLADDLAGSEVTATGGLVPGRIGGSITEYPERLEFRGAVAALRQLDQAFAAGRAVPLSRLTAMEWEEFVRSEASRLHYAEAAFLVRWLIDGGDPARAEGFRRFLAAVAAGGPVSGEALRGELGLSWEEIETGLARWVGERVSATRPEPGTAR